MVTVIIGTGFIAESLHKRLISLDQKSLIISARVACQARGLRLLAEMVDINLVIAGGITRHIQNDFASFQFNCGLIHTVLGEVKPKQLRALIFLSSVDVYGVSCEGETFKEHSPLKAQDYYSLAKINCENLIQYFCDIHKVPHLIPRLCGVYGNQDNGRTALSRMICDAKAEGRISLINGMETFRDYLLNTDLLRVLEIYLINPLNIGPLNLGSGNSHSLYDLAQIIERTIGRKLKIENCDSPNVSRVKKLNICIQKLQNYLPELRMTPLENGIGECL
jgi:nucleoside-diphosphate-sugar epimerase